MLWNTNFKTIFRISPDKILYHWTNNLKSDNNSEKTTSDIVNLGLSVKNEKTMVYVSSCL